MVYKLSEEFSKGHINYSTSTTNTTQIWLGMDDKQSEGKFTFSSDQTVPTFDAPWGLWNNGKSIFVISINNNRKTKFNHLL